MVRPDRVGRAQRREGQHIGLEAGEAGLAPGWGDHQLQEVLEVGVLVGGDVVRLARREEQPLDIGLEEPGMRLLAP